MNAEELKKRFGELIPLLQEVNAVSRNIEIEHNQQAILYKKKDISNVNTKKTEIIILEILICIGLVLGFLFLLLLNPSITLVVALVFSPVFIFILIKINARLFDKIREKDENRRRNLNEEFENKERLLNSKRVHLNELINIISAKINIVPPNYQYLMAIEYMYSYFCNGRADTIKEAVNLYEEELFRIRQEQRSEQLLELQTQQSYNISRIQKAASVTAVATSVNTINNIMKK